MTTAFVLLVAALAFALSAAAGMGGSLLLVPVLCLAMGTKQGIALAALMLACNNVGKVIAYRRDVPWRKSLLVLMCNGLGAALGALALVAAPEEWVSVAVVLSLASAFFFRNASAEEPRHSASVAYALAAGATSGFSGSSGPLKGASLWSLGLRRADLVGAASAVSLVTDVGKSAVFVRAGVLDEASWRLAALTVLIIPMAVTAGKRLNASVGERGYSRLFWAVIAGYCARLVLAATQAP